MQWRIQDFSKGGDYILYDGGTGEHRMRARSLQGVYSRLPDIAFPAFWRTILQNLKGRSGEHVIKILRTQRFSGHSMFNSSIVNIVQLILYSRSLELKLHIIVFWLGKGLISNSSHPCHMLQKHSWKFGRTNISPCEILLDLDPTSIPPSPKLPLVFL